MSTEYRRQSWLLSIIIFDCQRSSPKLPRDLPPIFHNCRTLDQQNVVFFCYNNCFVQYFYWTLNLIFSLVENWCWMFWERWLVMRCCYFHGCVRRCYINETIRRQWIVRNLVEMVEDMKLSTVIRGDSGHAGLIGTEFHSQDGGRWSVSFNWW